MDSVEHPVEPRERRFAWPPRVTAGNSPAGPPTAAAVAPAPPPPPAEPPGRRADPPRGIRGVVLEIERAWLGLSRPPLAVRMAESGWSPDALGAYCPRCGVTVGAFGADADGCTRCRDTGLPWDRMVRLGAYEGLLRELVADVKFTRWRRLGDELGVLLGRSLMHALRGADVGRVVLVPVPMSFRRRMARGIDHALVIARGMARETGLPIVRGLERSHRAPQTTLPRTRRLKNLAGSMRRRPGVALEGLHLVLVDDVKTTGATLGAACRGLGRGRGRAGSAAVWGAVAAVTSERPG